MRFISLLLLGLAVHASPIAPQPAVNADAAALKDFRDRVGQYVALRNKADNTAKPLKQTAESSDIRASQLEQAERIGMARKGAKPGDIFTPQVTGIIRRLLGPPVKEPGTKAEATDEEHLPTTITFKVNDQYPAKAPLSTVPPNMLAALPPLPKEVEYRLVGRHLIMRDATANLIVDYIVNALPKS